MLLLKPVLRNATPNTTVEIEDKEPEYEIEFIFDSKLVNNTIEYLVK